MSPVLGGASPSLAELLDARAERSGSERSILVPGVFNALSARLAEQAGFESVYLSGTATAASSFGLPDAGLIGRAELSSACRLITAATSVPVIADADTGYGEAVAIRHTVEEFARAGAAAITIEDQVHQKRCGYTEGVHLVSTDAMVERIRAATAARGAQGLTIIGRTDCLGKSGIDEAVERCSAMHAAGAEILWILGLQHHSLDELEEIRTRIPGRAMIDYTELERSPVHTFDALAKAGFEVVLVALTTVLASLRAMQSALRVLREQGDWTPYKEDLAPFDEFNRVAGLEEAAAFEQHQDAGDDLENGTK